MGHAFPSSNFPATLRVYYDEKKKKKTASIYTDMDRVCTKIICVYYEVVNENLRL